MMNMFVLQLSLGHFYYGNETWLIDSGATKHMTGYKESLSDLVMKESPHKVRFGDDNLCSIKGKGSTSYNLILVKCLKMEDVLCVPGLKRNLLSISGLEEKGFRVAFIDGEVLIWPKGKTIEDVEVIGIHEDGLYKLIGQLKPLCIEL